MLPIHNVINVLLNNKETYIPIPNIARKLIKNLKINKNQLEIYPEQSLNNKCIILLEITY